MILLTAITCLALTRAEIIARFKAPVVTQADGLVKVYADCPEDMRREFQTPIGRFAADTVQMLYRGLAVKPLRFAKPGIVIHIGEVRTNLAEVVSRVSTNDARVITRIYLPSPGYADIARFRCELIKAFYRSYDGTELPDAAAIAAYRRADPVLRISDERRQLELWLKEGKGDDEENLRLMRKVARPGVASPRDVLTFASRLFLYPPQYDLRFISGADCLSFRDALASCEGDPTVGVMALLKADELPVFGGGRGEHLARAADAYRKFLLEMARHERSESEIAWLLDDAEAKLNVAYEEALKDEEQ